MLTNQNVQTQLYIQTGPLYFTNLGHHTCIYRATKSIHEHFSEFHERTLQFPSFTLPAAAMNADNKRLYERFKDRVRPHIDLANHQNFQPLTRLMAIQSHSTLHTRMMKRPI